MTIKNFAWLFSTVLFSVFVLQCDKKTSEVILTEEIKEEPIGEYIDRDDITPPPPEPWWTIEVEELTRCQRALWSYLKNVYPIQDSLNPEYHIYTINNQPDEKFGFTQYISLFSEYVNNSYAENYLFNTEYSCPEELTADFFEGALGKPTCIAHNDIDNVITYSYYIKLRFRYGPCPYTRHDGEEVGSYCGGFQGQYCTKLRAIFSAVTGALVHIDFMTGV